MPEDLMKAIEVRIVRTNPKGVSPVYANDMMATHSEKEVFITFSLIEPPTGADENLKNLKEIEAIAVSKVLVTPDFAERIIAVMTEIVQRYKSRPK